MPVLWHIFNLQMEKKLSEIVQILYTCGLKMLSSYHRHLKNGSMLYFWRQNNTSVTRALKRHFCASLYHSLCIFNNENYFDHFRLHHFGIFFKADNNRLIFFHKIWSSFWFKTTKKSSLEIFLIGDFHISLPAFWDLIIFSYQGLIRYKLEIEAVSNVSRYFTWFVLYKVWFGGHGNDNDNEN